MTNKRTHLETALKLYREAQEELDKTLKKVQQLIMVANNHLAIVMEAKEE